MWIATTKSGRTYEEVPGGVMVSKEGFFSQPELRTFPFKDVKDLTKEDGYIDWDKMRALPLVTRPVVGELLYISTYRKAMWRISTEIISVEEKP